MRAPRLRALCAMLCVALLPAGGAAADGEAFIALDELRPQILRYVGEVKDTNGKPLDKFVVAITVKNIGLTFPFRNDAPGHFRSPDIGRAILGLKKPIDQKLIEVNLVRRGYRVVSVRQRPLEKTVDVTIIVAPL